MYEHYSTFRDDKGSMLTYTYTRKPLWKIKMVICKDKEF